MLNRFNFYKKELLNIKHKVYLPQSTLSRIQECLLFIVEKDWDLTLTKHWIDWLSVQKENITIGPNFVEIDTSKKMDQRNPQTPDRINRKRM